MLGRTEVTHFDQDIGAWYNPTSEKLKLTVETKMGVTKTKDESRDSMDLVDC